MAESKKADAGVILSLGAAVGVAALALSSRKAEAAPLPDTFHLDDETMQLLLAMANQLGQLDKIQGVIDAINNIQITTGGQGWPENTDQFICFVMPFNAANVADKLPEIAIPSGFTLALKADPANAGMILIGPSSADATNPNQAWPLMPNEAITLAVKKMDAVWASATFAGDSLHCIVEARV